MKLVDQNNREFNAIRLSVTDRCNYRCRYCMPESEYKWLPQSEILTFEEIIRFVKILTDLGVNKVRLTGGEPLLRHDIHQLVRMIKGNERVVDLALTTNGMFLEPLAKSLVDAGLNRITVSLDTLRSDRYQALTGSDGLSKALKGLRAVKSAGMVGVKINTVVMRGVNDDELVDLVQFGQKEEIEVRFIEYMDVGGATQWSSSKVVPRNEVVELLGGALGGIQSLHSAPSAPAQRFSTGTGAVFGLISSVSEPFCGHCDRSRLTADGMWYLCLYASDGLNIRKMIRGGMTDQSIKEEVQSAWAQRTDRGAEERMAVKDRKPLFEIESLRTNPHLEMHTRGG